MMLPVDMNAKRLCMAMDRLLACVGEALLLARRVREAATAGETAMVNSLAAQTARMAEEVKAAGRELLACADTGGVGSAEAGEGFLAYVARTDSRYGTDLCKRLEGLAETARAMAVEQAANLSLLGALARELDKYTTFLMKVMGGWVIYADDGTAVAEGGAPRRVSFSA